MTDHDQLLAGFRSEVPLPDAETAARIRGEATRPPVARRRQLLSRRQIATIALAAAALVVVGGSVAAVLELPWWQRGAPPVDPQSVASIARDNLPANVDASRARTVARAGDAALGRSDRPLGGPGRCSAPDGEPASSAVRPFAGVSFSVEGGGIVIGQVGAGSGVAKVVLSSASGTTVLPLGGGWFIGQLPEGGAKGELPPGGPFVLIAYDQDGKELARTSLERIRRAATPG